MNRLTFLTLSVVISSSALNAQAPDPALSEVVLKLPGMAATVIDKDIVFDSVATGPLHFDLYKPNGPVPTGGRPAVVFVSGAEDARNWKWYQSYGRLAAAKSLVGIVPAKRYPRGFAGIQSGYADTESVLKYLRANASRLGIDSSKICVWAFSAGGRLMSVALADTQEISCIVAFYPVADMTGDFATVADTVQRASLLARFSPPQALLARKRPLPPLLIARAGKDSPGINSSIDRFMTAAIGANADVTFVNYPEGVHGFDAYNDTAQSRAIIEQALDFIVRATTKR